MANNRKNRQQPQQQNFDDSSDLGRASRVSSSSFDDSSDLGQKSRVSSSSFDDDTNDIRQAGDLYGSDMARDDRKLREQRAENPKPNEDH